ncbi:hypothetical protein [Streptomyces sp. NPDC091212]|uniref:hypothetical protein n=1 Tax=Streptomyces sp. NPDC091212 TaxID=3155191 RepID=UPI00342AEFB5
MNADVLVVVAHDGAAEGRVGGVRDEVAADGGGGVPHLHRRRLGGRRIHRGDL